MSKLAYLICCIFIFGCACSGETASPVSHHPAEENVFYITWEEDALGDVTYIVNQQKLAGGRRCFKNLLKHLETLDDGAKLIVYPDLALKKCLEQPLPVGSTIFRTPETVPFIKDASQHKKLIELVRKKNMSYWRATANPQDHKCSIVRVY